jgi:ribosome-binding protein aMBF1 (putative translation factor)
MQTGKVAQGHEVPGIAALAYERKAMKTVAEVIAAARSRSGECSAYRLSKILGVSAQFIHQVTAGQAALPERMQLQLAEILDIDPAVVRVIAEAERAKSPAMRKALQRAAATLGAGALALALAVFPASPSAAPVSQNV